MIPTQLNLKDEVVAVVFKHKITIISKRTGQNLMSLKMEEQRFDGDGPIVGFHLSLEENRGNDSVDLLSRNTVTVSFNS